MFLFRKVMISDTLDVDIIYFTSRITLFEKSQVVGMHEAKLPFRKIPRRFCYSFFEIVIILLSYTISNCYQNFVRSSLLSTLLFLEASVIYSEKFIIFSIIMYDPLRKLHKFFYLFMISLCYTYNVINNLIINI